jgi:hypothetical protein
MQITPKPHPLRTDTSDDSGYVVMGRNSHSSGVAGMTVTSSSSAEPLTSSYDPLTSSNSYENLNSLTSSPNTSLTSPPLHRDPLYENQKESLAAKKLRNQSGKVGSRYVQVLHHSYAFMHPPQSE